MSRKTIYYWRRKYPQFDLEIEMAEGRLLFMYERIYFALAVGMDISKEYPDFEQVKISQIKYQLKRLYPQIYNPRSTKFKNS